jgi:hypothetical protein
MLASARLLALIVVGIVATSNASLAQTVAGTASDWGLLGTWTTDCSQPANSYNSVYLYVVRDGKLFLDRDLGATQDSSGVMSATIKPDRSLELVVNFLSVSPPQTRQFSYVKASDGRIRVVSNRNVDTNEYSIIDGKVRSNGNAVPWQTRCR